MRYYEQYLGKAVDKGSQRNAKFILKHVALALLIATCIVFAARKIYQRLSLSDSKARIGRDCEQAILKKQRLERGLQLEQN